MVQPQEPGRYYRHRPGGKSDTLGVCIALHSLQSTFISDCTYCLYQPHVNIKILQKRKLRPRKGNNLPIVIEHRKGGRA